MRLSAVLVVRDEEAMLEGALRTLGFCDEIIVVVDDRTVDRSEEIARRHTDRVLVRPFSDFAQMCNEGVEHSTGDWILHMDADERITPQLAREMRAVVDSSGAEFVAFWGPTINFFWGVRMEHGGWGRMMQLRLLRREYASIHGRVHPGTAVPSNRVGVLKSERWHFSHRSIKENLGKTILYGELEAADRLERGDPPVRPFRFAKVMVLEFGRRMIWRRGYRDGMPGIIEAVFQPFALFCAQVMLWERQQGDAIARRYQELERRVLGEL